MKREQKSPFYNMWEDKAEAERCQLYAKTVFEQLKNYQHASRLGHMEYAKWLVASLLAVHGGAIFAISNLRSSVREDQLIGLISAAGWNLAGIFMVLVAGFCGWLNLQCAESTYDRWANPEMLYRSDCFPDDDR